MSLLCLILGHRWETFTAEQCPEIYRVCERCDQIEHVCNGVKFALASDDTRPEGGDSTEIEAPFTGGAVPEGQTPNPLPPKAQSCVSTEPIVE
jgi:hypothetical protein